MRNRYRLPTPRCRTLVREFARGGRGLELGGPSSLFKWWLPVYPVIGALDNVNFSPVTVWEGAIAEGDTFAFHPRREPGRQYILEATDLRPLKDDEYDLVISSHTLEHSANPLRALSEWKRVLRPQGCLVLVLPHKAGTFDHRRPVTTLDHLRADYEQGTTEDDLTHYDEILALHDLALDPPAGTRAQFAARSAQNLTNRCLHHHVFDTDLAIAMVDQAGFEVVTVEARRPFHIIVIARSTVTPDNTRFMRPGAAWRRRSPFTLDRKARTR